jgi:HK97 family phage major capsid protein
MEKKLQDILAQLKGIIDAHKGIPMPEAIATQHDALVVEATGIQKDLDRVRASTKLIDGFKVVPEPTQVPDDQPEQDTPEVKAEKALERRRAIAGYVSVGAFVAASKGMRAFLTAGMPKHQFPLVQLPGLRNKHVGLTAEAVREFKSVPVLGADVIVPEQVDTVRAVEHDRLLLLDVINRAPTTKDAVRYTRIVGFTRSADAVVRGDAKPQGALELESLTSTVRTLAVWIPVQNEQMDDLPELANLIDSELLYDLAKRKEELIAYGNGIGEQFDGLFNDPDVLLCRAEGGDTLIDIIRRGITDVMIANFTPNAVIVDPRDWETIVLAKGSDLRYIVQVMVTAEGEHRLWGVPVIETVAMRDNAGAIPEERNLIVGDFMRGATLWERMAPAISVGFINDQFVRNQRTILAEERAAFAIRRPLAFRKYVTQVASAS